MTLNKGFTLVEILIVVIILGILAAIVIPQFSSASNDARESALASDLQTLRSQMELYNIQHLDQYPDVSSANGGATWTSDGNIVARMIGKTDEYGQTGTTFGPYMQKFPTNAFNGKFDVVVEATPCAGDGSTGWHFDTSTGRLSPNDTPAHAAL